MAIRRPFLGALFALGLLVGSAADPSHAVAQDTAAAREAFSSGVREFEAGRFEQALENFREAYRIRPHPSVLVNMANCFMEMNQPVEAGEHFERYLRESGSDIDPATRSEVERALGSARAALATVEVDAPPGTRIFIDGREQGQTPLSRPLEVNPGSHTVELHHTNGSTQSQPVMLDRGGSASVHGEPGPPVAGGDNPYGEGEGGDEDGGGGLSIPLLTWVFGGVAVATLIGGIAFGATALSQQGEVEDLVAQAQDARRRMDTMQEDQLLSDARETDDARATNAVLSDVFFITAALSAGAAVVFFFITPADDDDEPATTVGAAPLPGGGGLLTLRGHM